MCHSNEQPQHQAKRMWPNCLSSAMLLFLAHRIAQRNDDESHGVLSHLKVGECSVEQLLKLLLKARHWCVDVERGGAKLLLESMKREHHAGSSHDVLGLLGVGTWLVRDAQQGKVLLWNMQHSGTAERTTAGVFSVANMRQNSTTANSTAEYAGCQAVMFFLDMYGVSGLSSGLVQPVR